MFFVSVPNYFVLPANGGLPDSHVSMQRTSERGYGVILVRT